MFPIVCGAWSRTEAARALLEDLTAAARAADLNMDQWADLLDVNRTALSHMVALRESGPGILRFAHLPPTFWVALLKARAKRYCLRVIDEPWIDRVMSRLDFLQVALLERQLEDKRMAKMALPEAAEVEKAS